MLKIFCKICQDRVEWLIFGRCSTILVKEENRNTKGFGKFEDKSLRGFKFFSSQVLNIAVRPGKCILMGDHSSIFLELHRILPFFE